MNLEAVYPNPNDPNEEFSFEEFRARFRGWMDKDWAAERRHAVRQMLPDSEQKAPSLDVDEQKTKNTQAESISLGSAQQDVDVATQEETTQGTRSRKSRRTKVMEVKGETQTSKRLRLEIFFLRILNCDQLKPIWNRPQDRS